MQELECYHLLSLTSIKHMGITGIDVIERFVINLNERNLDGILEVLSEEHAYYDSQGNCIDGKENLYALWSAHLKLFSYYKLEVDHIFESEDDFALFGVAYGAFSRRQNPGDKWEWRHPAAWRLNVKNEQIERIEVYSDTRLPIEIY